jgi:hypothetical protein
VAFTLAQAAVIILAGSIYFGTTSADRSATTQPIAGPPVFEKQSWRAISNPPVQVVEVPIVMVTIHLA